MVALDVVRQSNARLHELGPGLVALFVGATSGIGEHTAKAFVKNTLSPRVYIVGRSSEAADRIIGECKALNKDGKVVFIKADVSLIQEVDRVCEDIQAREKHINLIVQTQGNFNMRGRDESPEGLDRKFVLNFYSRMRFIFNLLPLLQNSSTSPSGFSRSISVLSPGSEEKINVDDLELKNSFSAVKCAAHSTVMNDFMIEEFSARAPATSFEHNYPSYVESGLMREMPLWAKIAGKVLTPLLSPFKVSNEETGARQLFHATSAIYRPAKLANDSKTAAGVSVLNELKIAEGADGKEGSGAYLLNWNSHVIYPKAFVKDYRRDGYSKIIWDHTMSVFERVEKANRSA